MVRYDPQSPWGEQQASSSQDAPEVNPEMFQGTGGVNALAENSRGVIYFGAQGARLYSHMGWELSQHIDSHCMHIASIEMFLFGNDEIMGAGAKIMVVDDEGNPDRGATVVGNWTGISIGDNFDGYTDIRMVMDWPIFGAPDYGSIPGIAGKQTPEGADYH